jgi:homoserine kinase
VSTSNARRKNKPKAMITDMMNTTKTTMAIILSGSGGIFIALQSEQTPKIKSAALITVTSTNPLGITTVFTSFLSIYRHNKKRCGF